jgi:DNA-binding response OmpR family regulator
MSQDAGLLTIGDLSLNPLTREVKKGARVIRLTPKEFSILEYLMRHPDVVLRRSQIEDYAWGSPLDSSSNIVDTHIGRIRMKLGHSQGKKLIETMWCIGYKLKPPHSK